jgi:hypothetical protein
MTEVRALLIRGGEEGNGPLPELLAGAKSEKKRANSIEIVSSESSVCWTKSRAAPRIGSRRRTAPFKAAHLLRGRRAAPSCQERSAGA